MLDSSSPFYIAPRPSPALARWLWLFRAACSEERAQAAAPVLRALHVASARLHDELAAGRGEQWRFHHDGELQVYETPAGLAAADAGRRAGPRAGRARRRGDGGRGAPAVPQPPLRARRSVLLPRGRPPRPAALHARGRRARRGGRRRGGDRAEALALEPAPRRRARRHDPRRVRGRPGRAGRRRLDAVPDARARPAAADRAGQGLQRRRRSGRTDFPELPLYLGDAHVVLTPLGDSLRLGSTLELSGWDMRIRPKRVAYLSEGGRRAIGLPADGPVRQLWRGPRPVTPTACRSSGECPAATGSSWRPATACSVSPSARSPGAWSRSWRAAPSRRSTWRRWRCSASAEGSARPNALHAGRRGAARQAGRARPRRRPRRRQPMMAA